MLIETLCLWSTDAPACQVVIQSRKCQVLYISLILGHNIIFYIEASTNQVYIYWKSEVRTDIADSYVFTIFFNNPKEQVYEIRLIGF